MALFYSPNQWFRICPILIWPNIFESIQVSWHFKKRFLKIEKPEVWRSVDNIRIIQNIQNYSIIRIFGIPLKLFKNVLSETLKAKNIIYFKHRIEFYL